MHYYKRNLGDYAKKTGRLTMLQHGSYTLLIDSCYDREVFPTLEQALEWTWASTEAEVDAVKFVLSRFFTLDKNGCYVQDRILQELLEYHAKADINKRIAIERETKRREKSTNRGESVYEAPHIGNEAPPNHKPITINQEPIIEVAKATLPSAKLMTCPQEEILKLWSKHLPHLAQPRSWEGTRRANTKQRWNQASKPSAYSPDGYQTEAAGIKWWDSFFNYIAQDTSLASGFETAGRTWRPDLEWVMNATNFQKIIDGKYTK
jgi:uncharacterized protein YdaU (DUF1376 family)